MSTRQWLWITIGIIVSLIISGVLAKVSRNRGRASTDQQLVTDRHQASTLRTEATDTELDSREFQADEHLATAQDQQEDTLQGRHHADEIDPDVDGPPRRAPGSRLEDDMPSQDDINVLMRKTSGVAGATNVAGGS